MRNTTNYSLLLPDKTDFYNVDDMNSNIEIIDAQMKSNQTKADAVTGNHNTHVANKSNPHGVTKEQVGLGNVPNVSTNNQAPTYAETSALSALVSGEVLSTAFGKLAKAVSSLISHIGNISNPHGVTKAQIGLGSVPNVSTNDQTPTYTDVTTLTTLASGEKMSAAFPKIKLAISNLISHLSDAVKHITAAERSSWNAKADGTLLNNRIPQYFNVSTQAELDAIMNGHSTNLAINTYYNFTLSVATSNLSILGGTYYVEGMKTSADYEWQRMTKYPNGNTLPPLLIMGRSKFGGTWTNWENIAMQSQLSTNDYTTTEKTKLAGIAAGAQVNTITGVKGNGETAYRTGQVNITPANIGLGNVNNTADSAKSVLSATKLTAPRTISLTGDVTGSVSFDGSGNVSMTTAVADDSHNHIISNVDGLQAALDDKLGSIVYLEILGLLEQRVHIGSMANNRLSLQWIDTTSELKVFIDGIDMGAVMLSKG